MYLKSQNIFNSFFLKKFNSIIFSKGKKYKYLSFIFLIFKTLKKKKYKPFFFFFLILERLKPIFSFSKKKLKIKKKKKIIYKPYLLPPHKQYIIGIKWFVTSLKKKSKKKFIDNLKDIFLVFLPFYKLENKSIILKKKAYLIVLRYRRFIKFN